MRPRPLHTKIMALILAVLVSESAWLGAVTQGPELPDPGARLVDNAEQLNRRQLFLTA